MIYFDTETCGFHGPIVLLQWAEDDGEIHLHEPWRVPVGDTIDLIEKIANHPDGVCGFNLAFDWFHLCQMYTTLLLMNRDDYPDENVQFYAEMEAIARDGPCLKPVTAFDIMMHARKGPYQSTMDRGDIRIKKIPTVLATALAVELERRVPLRDIYFARRKNKFEPHWKIYDREDELGEVEIGFKDVVLKFAASSALKALAIDALELPVDVTLFFTDVSVAKVHLPVEVGYAPFAMAHWKDGQWNGAWPDVIKYHIGHWGFDSLARKYAAKDVEYTRDLYKYFGRPASGDDDSILACMVGAVRWKGFSIDVEGMKQLRIEAIKKIGQYPTAPEQAKRYIQQHMDEAEIAAMRGTTKKTVLETVAKLPNRDDGTPHPAAKAATEVLEARKAIKEREMYDKLIFAGRFHASFVVIGALSSRMAGTDDFNAQGVKKTKAVRSKFSLNWPGYVLCVPSDTWTLTEEGPRQVSQLIGKATRLYVDGKLYDSTGFFSTGRQEIFEILTKSGYRVRATENHPFLTSRGTWRPLKWLEIGDKLQLNCHKDVEWADHGTWNEGYILGQLFGDGSVYPEGRRTRHKLEFFPGDYCLVDFTAKLFDEYPQVKLNDCGSYEINSLELEKLRQEYGFGSSKIITREIETASSEFLSGFVSAFFDSDGNPNCDETLIDLSQSNLQRLEAIQRILLRFGIRSRIRKEREDGQMTIQGRIVNCKAKYVLTIGRENVLVFNERIGFCHPKKKGINKKNIDRILNRFYGKRHLAREDFQDKIVSIVSLGIQEVYDVHVPKIHAFDANGFVVHNCGGDFSGFEVVLADAVYNDPGLRVDLQSGMKIHALFGQYVYPGMSYEDILATDGTEMDLYTRAKSAVFAMFYGGEGYTLMDRLGVPIEDANAAYEKFCRRYPGVGIARQRMVDAFQTLRQEGGIGTKIEYHEPKDFVESLFGFRRFFNLENQIIKALIELAQKPPPSWRMEIKVVRRDRTQYVQGAVQSALYGAAFGMQGSNMRAATNHEIQSSGATITKLVQRKIWNLQPSGVHDWVVQPMNIHDEIECVTHPDFVTRVREVVGVAVESVRPKVPLIKIEWKDNMANWADKK